MRNAHLQTLAGNFLPRNSLLPAPEERLFQVDEGVQILCHCHWQPERISALTVIIVHGLEGSSSSQYVIGTGSKAWAKGMNVVRMNMRNCGGTDRLAKSLYHSGLSQDVLSVASTLAKTESLVRITLVGFSMGGNLVLKLAGELGQQLPPVLRAVAAVSPVMDLALSAEALHHKQNFLYEAKFLFGLKRRFRRKVKMFPDMFKQVNMQGMLSVRDFDHRITAKYSGFTDADDYYNHASSGQVLDKISIPTLIIHSRDDPFIKTSQQTMEKVRGNPMIQYIETQNGGHCAFLAPTKGYDGRWAEQTVIWFLGNY